MEEQEHRIPQALLRIRGLKEPDRLPRYLTDAQVHALSVDLTGRPRTATAPTQRRDALLDHAAFLLLWHGGLRLGELEQLQMDDLDLDRRQVMIRCGKGLRDRAVYLTDVAVSALRDYLRVRGLGSTDHVFLYRNAPLCADLVRGRLKACGERVGVHVSPHRLRHTFATQLVNAGCRITSLQKLLGHQRLNSTMVYARVYDRTVEEDYYAAMAVVEERFEQGATQRAQSTGAPVAADQRERLLCLIDSLAAPLLASETRLHLIEELRSMLRGEVLPITS